MIVAAVPVKDLVNAKQRLVPALDATQRAALATAMLEDVLAALVHARLDRVWVVTHDAAVVRLAGACGVEVLGEGANRGHTAAVAHAQAEAVRRDARVFVTIPGDVPCVTGDEIRQLAAAAELGRPVFAPSRSGLGTNGVALAPADAMPLRFGEPSFDNHLAAARARGLEPRVLALPGLGLDVDAPDDLAALLAASRGTASVRLVSAWDVARRMQPAGVSRA